MDMNKELLEAIDYMVNHLGFTVDETRKVIQRAGKLVYYTIDNYKWCKRRFEIDKPKVFFISLIKQYKKIQDKNRIPVRKY